MEMRQSGKEKEDKLIVPITWRPLCPWDLPSKCSAYLDQACTPRLCKLVAGMDSPSRLLRRPSGYSRMCVCVCVQKRLSYAILFVDLREAFHRVVCPFIHGGKLQMHQLAGIVEELGLGPDTIRRLHEYARELSLLLNARPTSWTARIMQAARVQ